MNKKEVWIFSGENGRLPSAVFSDYEKARSWIEHNKLSGLLTEYPLDQDVYSWAIDNNYFVPKNSKEKTSEYIQKFSSAMQKHYHFENGVEE